MLIKTALDFPWWLAYLIPPRLLKFSKFSILYIPTNVILRCLTRYRVTRSFIRLTVRPFFGGFSRSRLHSGVQYKSFIASIWFMQCSKLLPVRQPEADNFGGGLGTFLRLFFNFMLWFEIQGSRTDNFFYWVLNTGLCLPIQWSCTGKLQDFQETLIWYHCSY